MAQLPRGVPFIDLLVPQGTAVQVAELQTRLDLVTGGGWRILADDGFLFKLGIEALLACTVQAVAEVHHRGEDFWSEIDFALGDIFSVFFASSVGTVLAAPVAVPRKAKRRETRVEQWFRTCPSSFFQEGPPPYSILQRFGTLLSNMPRLFATGFCSSFVCYLYITVLLLLRHACSKVLVGGKWRRKPKTLKDLNIKTLRDWDPQQLQALEPEDRQGLLDEAGLGGLRCGQ